VTTLEDLPPTIAVEEAGRLLGLSRTSAYRAAARGELPTIRLNGRLHVPTARLRTLLGIEDRSTDQLLEAG
jgi:excisionase family DNA binding protein